MAIVLQEYLKYLKTVKNSSHYELVKTGQTAGCYSVKSAGRHWQDTSQHIFVFHRTGRRWNYWTKIPDSLISANTVRDARPANGKILT